MMGSFISIIMLDGYIHDRIIRFDAARCTSRSAGSRRAGPCGEYSNRARAVHVRSALMQMQKDFVYMVRLDVCLGLNCI